MQTALYIIWFLIPIFFFVLALWSKLEHISSKGALHGRQAKDFFIQGSFVLGCVLVALFIDLYTFDAFIRPALPPSIPTGFVKIILLPLILLIGAKVVGGSKPVRIVKAPRVSKNRKGKR